jgi:nitronate monooxygenase
VAAGGDSRFSPLELEQPIVQGPMAGGNSTPALAAAVSGAGGLGFLAAGYKTAEAVGAEIEELRGLTDRPYGVNLFVPSERAAPPALVERYAASLGEEAERYGVALGEPRHDDDDWQAKLALVVEARVPVVSFTFGCPAPGVVAELRRAGAAVWVTVTTAEEARVAERAGADALVVQGVEAGAHRGSFDNDAPGDVALLPLLQLVAAAVDLPLVASGGLARGRAVAGVLAAGAAAAQLGTAFLLTPEAGTSAAHRQALGGDADTALTRAFSGRTARGLVNRFLREHGEDAPSAYPEVHHLTTPIRAAARERGDPDGLNLWAGQAYSLTEELPASELVRRLGEEARAALGETARRLS